MMMMMMMTMRNMEVGQGCRDRDTDIDDRAGWHAHQFLVVSITIAGMALLVA